MNTKKFYILISSLLIILSVIFLTYLLMSNQKTTIEPTSYEPTITPVIFPSKNKTAKPVVPVTTASPEQTTEITTHSLENIKTALSKEDIGVANIRILGNYAVATVFSKNGATDDASIILRKDNKTWIIIAGPNTFFDQDILNSLNLPSSIIEEANNIP
jgi:hypothetical protein